MNKQIAPIMPRWVIIATLLTGLCAAYASLAGLFDATTYSQETANWATQGKGQDIGNLIALPLLLASLYWAVKRNFTGYAMWLGTMFYYLYAYVIYAFAVHLGPLFLVYTVVAGMAFYSIAWALSRSSSVKPMVSRSVFAGGVLALIGTLFGFLWLSELLPAIQSGQIPQSLKEAGLIVNPVHVIDLSVVLPGMLLSGVALLRGQGSARRYAEAWLIFSVLMGTSIVATMIMMVSQGFESAIAPLIMVAIIVVMSKFGLASLLLWHRSPETQGAQTS